MLRSAADTKSSIETKKTQYLDKRNLLDKELNPPRYHRVIFNPGQLLKVVDVFGSYCLGVASGSIGVKPGAHERA